MTKKPANKQNSTLITILGDAMEEVSVEQRDMIGKLLKSLPPAAVKKIDDRYNARTYSSSSIKYARIPTYNDADGAAMDELEGPVLAIFISLMRSMLGTYYVRTNNTQIASVTGFSRPTVIKGIKWLVDNGYLAIHTPASGKRTDNIYMLNPDCVGTGKTLHKSSALAEFEALAGKTAMIAFHTHRHHRKWQAAAQSFESNYQRVRCAQILPYDGSTETEKEPSDAPLPDSSTTKKTVPSKKPRVKPGKSVPRDFSTYPDNLPGQMNITDYINVPADVNDPNLPFN